MFSHVWRWQMAAVAAASRLAIRAACQTADCLKQRRYL
jgi:anti-sigma-K factor RskA